ncbi:HAD-IIB family hydrolase [Acidobacteriota bacterium]
MDQPNNGLYIALISIHGLIRGQSLELGRDADTGGQTKYVVELTKALGQNPNVARVDLLTRLVTDPKVDSDYAKPVETLGPKANIIRLSCGPRRYLRKEVLWPYFDAFADNALQHIRKVGRVPDVIHGHYADAGYVGSILAGLLGVPLIQTGHSLGRVKRQRLLENGMKESAIESQYNITQRIEAEELAMDSAALVITSTRQEVEEQYKLYDNYQKNRMQVIPPGVDLSRFRPPRRWHDDPSIKSEVLRFLRQPNLPLIMALSRPDERKNVTSLIKAYSENPQLRKKANLFLVLGNRDDIQTMEKGPRQVLSSMIMLVDKYDLYGKIAYPKHHKPEDVSGMYRIAAKTRGVFVNPALTEPFGLTLLEAAASGLPVVATEDGGPWDILHYCKNGMLIDPLDVEQMGKTILDVLSDRDRWQRWSRNGLRGVHRRYSWDGHVKAYLNAIHRITGARRKKSLVVSSKSRLPTVDRILVSDIDNTLIGDEKGLRRFLSILGDSGENVGFGLATGRRLDSALDVLKKWKVPIPDLMITAVGSEIYYGPHLVKDTGWVQHIKYRWDPQGLREIMKEFPGLKRQKAEEQREFKISYLVDPKKAPSVKEIVRYLRRHDLHANVIYSHEAYLDLLPIRASKGGALRYLGVKWGLRPERFLVAGDSGNDEEMLRGNTLGVVVGNYSKELNRLRGKPRIYFAGKANADGIIEGIDYYDFLGVIQIPEEAEPKP